MVPAIGPIHLDSVFTVL